MHVSTRPGVGTRLADLANVTHIADRADASTSPPACPQCQGVANVFLIVPMGDNNPWNWFRCARCDHRFTPPTVNTDHRSV
jgi:hypothetical protein